ILDLLQPIIKLWGLVIEHPLGSLLSFMYDHLVGLPFIDTIGAYGVAIIVVTILIRLALAPLQQFQLVTQRRTVAEQRKVAPEVAQLKKKYGKDSQKLNAEMMKLYQEHGVNPLGGLVGCLPLIVQIPVLTALYWVFRNAHVGSPHFVVGWGSLRPKRGGSQPPITQPKGAGPPKNGGGPGNAKQLPRRVQGGRTKAKDAKRRAS